MIVIDVSFFIGKYLRHSTFSFTDKIVISNNQSVITLYMSVLNETQYSQMKSLGTFEFQGPLFINHTTFFYLDPKFNAYLDIGKIGYNLPNFFVIFYAIAYRLKSRTFPYATLQCTHQYQSTL